MLTDNIFTHTEGSQTHFHVSNSGKEEAIILFHGWMHSGNRWQELMDVIPNEYTVYAPDLPGFGRSKLKSEKTGTYMESLAQCAEEFLLEVHKNHKIKLLLGHSMGSQLIIMLSSRDTWIDPENIFLLDTPTTGGMLKYIGVLNKLFQPSINTIQKLPKPLSRVMMALSAIPTVLRVDKIDQTIIDDALAGDSTIAGELVREMSQINTLERAKEANFEKSNVMVGRGKFDILNSHKDFVKLSSILNAGLITFKGASHTPQLETPDLVSQAVLSFIDDPNTYIQRNSLH